jgi:hypothetical protein
MLETLLRKGEREHAKAMPPEGEHKRSTTPQGVNGGARSRIELVRRGIHSKQKWPHTKGHIPCRPIILFMSPPHFSFLRSIERARCCPGLERCKGDSEAERARTGSSIVRGLEPFVNFDVQKGQC